MKQKGHKIVHACGIVNSQLLDPLHQASRHFLPTYHHILRRTRLQPELEIPDSSTNQKHILHDYTEHHKTIMEHLSDKIKIEIPVLMMPGMLYITP